MSDQPTGPPPDPSLYRRVPGREMTDADRARLLGTDDDITVEEPPPEAAT